jgi:hypothetical protein
MFSILKYVIMIWRYFVILTKSIPLLDLCLMSNLLPCVHSQSRANQRHQVHPRALGGAAKAPSGRQRPGQAAAVARFIGIPIKDRLQVDAVQGREQQGDDCDRLRHANPPSSLIPYVSLPDVGKVRIAATFYHKAFQ